MKKPWLWIILVVVVLAAAGFLIWQYRTSKTVSVTTSPSPTKTGVAGEIDAVGADLQKLDDNFNQLDKIDASNDEAPVL